LFRCGLLVCLVASLLGRLDDWTFRRFGHLLHYFCSIIARRCSLAGYLLGYLVA
jgi:hypothetical protein